MGDCCLWVAIVFSMELWISVLYFTEILLTGAWLRVWKPTSSQNGLLLPSRSSWNVSQTGFKAANNLESSATALDVWRTFYASKCSSNIIRLKTETNLNTSVGRWGRENGPSNDGSVLISLSKSCLFCSAQIASNCRSKFHSNTLKQAS